MVKSALPLQLKQIRILTAALLDTQGWGNTRQWCLFLSPPPWIKEKYFQFLWLNHSNATYFRRDFSDLCNWKWELNLAISAKVLALLSQESLEVLSFISAGESPAHRVALIRFSLAFRNNVEQFCSWFQWGCRLNDKSSKLIHKLSVIWIMLSYWENGSVVPMLRLTVPTLSHGSFYTRNQLFSFS